MLIPFTTWNNGKPYAQQVKPYNFMLTAFVRRFGHPAGVDPDHFHLVAPFEDDARKWSSLAWRNLYDQTGTPYTIRAGSSPYAVQGEVEVKTYRDVLDEYRRYPETKSLAPDGMVCSGSTVGLLQRRPVVAAYVTHVGKESNRLEEVEAGLVHDPDEVYTEYEDVHRGPWQTLVLPVLRRMPQAMLAAQVGLSARTIAAVRNGHVLPRVGHREALIRAAAAFAREQLQAAGRAAPTGDLEACSAYHLLGASQPALHHRASERSTTRTAYTGDILDHGRLTASFLKGDRQSSAAGGDVAVVGAPRSTVWRDG